MNLKYFNLRHIADSLNKFKYKTKNDIYLNISNINNKLKTNIKNISDNTSNIKTNIKNISDNTSNIKTNNENISDNTSNIKTNNENNISDNIESLQKDINNNNDNIKKNIENLQKNINDNIKKNIENLQKNINDNIKKNIENLQKNINDNDKNIKKNIESLQDIDNIENLINEVEDNNDNILENKKDISKLKYNIYGNNENYIILNLHIFNMITENLKFKRNFDNQQYKFDIFEQDISDKFYKDQYIECNNYIHIDLSSYELIGYLKFVYEFYNNDNNYLFYTYKTIMANNGRTVFNFTYQRDFFHVNIDSDCSSIKIKGYILDDIRNKYYEIIFYKQDSLFNLKIIQKI